MIGEGGSFARGFVACSSLWNLRHGGHRCKATSRLTGDDGATSHELRTAGRDFKFPLKAGLTAGSLTLLGDTLAQFYGRYRALQKREPWESTQWDPEFWQHDWIRALRMGSYGLLCYGPLSYSWYNMLDHVMPVKNLANFMAKVVLNQLVLGPIVIGVVFAWNAVWTRRLRELPGQYRRLALPTLLDGWKFWTPMVFVNFGLIPLEGRVAFMASCAVFWNFYLSAAVTENPTPAKAES